MSSYRPHSSARMRRGAWRALAIAVLILLALGFQTPMMARAVPGNVDLTVDVSGPASSMGTKAFTYRVEVGNLGPGDGAGATLGVDLSTPLPGLTATCISATGGASCPSLTVSSTAVTGVITALPSGARVVVEMVGTYPTSATSVTVNGHITPAADATETGPKSNSSSQSTALTQAATSVKMTKTQAKAQLAAGEEQEYTLTLANEGDVDLVQWNVYDRFLGWGGETAYTVTCEGSSSAGCPTWAQGAGLSGSISGGDMFSKNIDLPAHATLVLKVKAITTATACSPTGTITNTNVLMASRNDSRGVNVTSELSSQVSSVVTVDECSTAAVQITKVQDQAIVDSGASRDYTVTFKNDGPADLLGWYVRDRYINYSSDISQSTSFVVTCATSSTAPCPSWVQGQTQDASSMGDDTLFVNKIDVPTGTALVLNVRVTTTVTSGCFTGDGFPFVNYVAVEPRADNGTAAVGSLSTSVNSWVRGQQCASTTVDASKTQDLASVGSGQPNTYTITLANTGKTDLTQWGVRDRFITYGDGVGSTSYALTCDSSSTAPCPAWASGEELTTSGELNQSLTLGKVDLPAGTTLRLKVRVVATLAQCPTSASVQAVNVVDLDFADANGVKIANPQSPSSTGTLTCNDVSTQTAVSAGTPAAGQALVATSTVTNAVGTALNVPVTIQLPEGGFLANDLSIECSVSGAATCPSWEYDDASHSVRGVIAELPAGASVVVRLAGHAGIVPPATESYRVTTDAPSSGDIHPASNTSYSPFGIVNMRSTIAVGLTVSGGTPAINSGTVLNGKVVCEQQGSFPLQVTSDGVSHVVAEVWNQDTCRIQVDRPAAPAGFHWVDALGDGPFTVDLGVIDGPKSHMFAFVLQADVTVIAKPEPPAITDPCGPGNAEWVIPADRPEVRWQLTTTGELIAHAQAGFIFSDQSTEVNFGVAVDSGRVCPTGTPTSTPTSTPTGTPTSTPSGTPSSTPTSTPTGTPTSTPTGTPSSTPTKTPVGPGVADPTNPGGLTPGGGTQPSGTLPFTGVGSALGWGMGGLVAVLVGTAFVLWTRSRRSHS